MSMFLLSLRNLLSKPLTTVLNLILLSSGIFLISMLLQVDQQLTDKLYKNVRGIDLVVGAKGSPMQLILANVYHVDYPTGNISMKEAYQLKKNRLVKNTIPLAYGDNYQSFRIVGTTYDYTELYQVKVKEGKLWTDDFEVTIGERVAHETGMSIGDEFSGTHGLDEDNDEEHDHHHYKVVGVLKASGTVLDNLILTNMSSVWAMHEHVSEEPDHDEHHEEESFEELAGGRLHEEHDKHHEHDGEEEYHQEASSSSEDKSAFVKPARGTSAGKEITAMLIQTRNAMGKIMLPRSINENTSMQTAVPSFELDRMLQIMGFGFDFIKLIGWIIIVISAVSIFISLLNSLKERQYELALMRTIGATKWKIFTLIFFESQWLCLTGCVIGMIFGRVGLYIMSGIMEDSYHYSLSLFSFGINELMLLGGAVLLGILSSIIPAIRAYRLNIAKVLSNA